MSPGRDDLPVVSLQRLKNPVFSMAISIHPQQPQAASLLIAAVGFGYLVQPVGLEHINCSRAKPHKKGLPNEKESVFGS